MKTYDIYAKQNGKWQRKGIQGEPTLPEYDGTVIIEKAESVLGLRRFKETITPILLSEEPSSAEEYYNANFIEVEPVYNPVTDTNSVASYIYGYTPIYSVDGGVTLRLVAKMSLGEDMNIDNAMYMAVNVRVIPEGFEATVISTANTAVNEWVLANTEGVSV